MRLQTMPGGPTFYSTSLVTAHSGRAFVHPPRLTLSPADQPSLFPEYEGTVGNGVTVRVIDATGFDTADQETIRQRLMFEDGWGV
jgi:hypothetical protein